MELNSIQACLVCGAEASLKAPTHLFCQNCGFDAKFSADGIYTTEFDDAVVGYPEDGAVHTLDVEDHSFWFAHRHKVIEALLQKSPCSGTVLDIGGGNGFEAVRLQPQYSRLLLVEPGLSGCLAAKARGVRNVFQGTLESLRLRKESIQGACFFDVLEHLDDPQRLLMEARRLLVAGGKIYITVPAFHFLWSDEDDYARHQRRYSRKSLIRELSNAGFEVDYISYYFSPLLVPILLFRTLPSRLGLRQVQTMNKSEHAPEGIMQKCINFLLRFELRLIRNGIRLPFGSSLVCSATKIGSANP